MNVGLRCVSNRSVLSHWLLSSSGESVLQQPMLVFTCLGFGCFQAESWEEEARAAEMARLVAVCRDGEEEFPFEKRQIPLYIDDTLTVSGYFASSTPRLTC